jgi:hypothetical protein
MSLCLQPFVAANEAANEAALPNARRTVRFERHLRRL